MILALSGGKHSGKDTFFKSIKEEYSEYFSFVEKKFSYNMKLCACIVLGITMEQIEDQTFKETILPEFGITPRNFLDELGTSFGRKYLCEKFPLFKETVGERIWAMSCTKEAVKESKKDKLVVITDLRFLVEEKELRQCGEPLVIIRINRKNKIIDMSNQADNQVPYIKADYEIINEGTDLNKYMEDCKKLFKEIFI